jgi:hypothetical protein
MSLSPGRSLSHYRLVEPIGEGGMGVVWRATDSTLGRDVAIKVLPDAFASDPERMARFEREAKLLASLNHPNIASVFGLHSADGVRFLAMELVEGEDLAQRLKRGAIPLAEALPIALEISQALEHAHERGVIHRDLKPANVKLTQDGKAKVLDFGLAKALEGEGMTAASASGLTQSPTITGPMTGANVLLGTAAYMAPEQARGHAADRRADIWAFGVLVMEMLTGRRLFEGETISGTLASVLKSDPDWSALPKETPTRLRTLLRRCLERQPKLRLRDIGEARIALDEMVAGKDAEAPALAPAAPARSGSSTLFIGLAGLLIGAIVMFVAGRAMRPAAHESPLRKFHLALPAVEGQAPLYPAISPDGRNVAYVFGGAVWRQSMGELEPRELKADKDAAGLCWSPDGKSLGYAAGTRIMRISLDGGENQAVCDVGGEMAWGGGAGISWGDDGMIAFSRGDSGGVFRVSAAGGDPKLWIKLEASEGDLHQPCVLPGSKAVIFAAHKRPGGYDNITLWSDGRRKSLLEVPDQRISSMIYDPAGFILFTREPTTPGVWALPFSLSRLEATGPPFLVVPVGSFPSVSAEGTLTCLSAGAPSARQLAWYDREGKELRTIGDPETDTGFPSLSPDGNRVAWPITLAKNRDIWILDTLRGTRTRLTFDAGADEGSVWFPSGDRIAYYTLPKGANAPGFVSLARAADGTGAVDTLATGARPVITPDGRHAVYNSFSNSAIIWSLMEVPLQSPGTPRTLVTGNPRTAFGRVSPSGRFMAYMSNESGQWEVYLTRYPSCEGRWQVSTAGGQSPRWSARGDRLFFSQIDDIMEVEVSGTAEQVLGATKRLFTRPTLDPWNFGLYQPFDVTGDGTRFLITRPAGQKSAMQGVAVAQNWAAEFAKK